jgi:hypothetical protein
VAAYIAPECAKGRSNGSLSVPKPPETARRVDHASKAAALCPVAIKAYQILRWRGDSTGRITAGLMGAFKNDSLPGVMPAAMEDEEPSVSVPAEADSLGTGASGSFDFVAESGWGALELLASKVGESTTARGVSAGSAVQQKIRSADSTKMHLRSRRPGVGSWYAATAVHSTVPKDRCHWPIGHNLFWYFSRAGFWSVGTSEFDTPLAIRRKDLL